MICGGPRIPLTDEQAAALAPNGWACCMAAALADGDPRHCTCWEPIYDLDQADELATDLEPATRETRCHDCAFRPESADHDEFPEQADPDALERAVATGRPFWCHQGMRRLIAWQHPAGHRIDNPSHDYKGPQVDGVPYLADGRPAERCAGWARAREQLLQGANRG